MSKRDYYEVLGVSRSATDDELKKAYRKLAIEHHPDRNPGNKRAEEIFKEVNEAYQILSDPQKRSVYDRMGHAGFSQGGFEGGFSANFTDIFDNIFGDVFGRSREASGGIDLRYTLEITFEEAAFGCEKDIEFDKVTSCGTCRGSGAKPGSEPKACRHCKGTGQVRFNQGFFTLAKTCDRCMGRGILIEERCPECRGKGLVKRPSKVKVKIPAGIDSEQRLKLKGEGEVEIAGATPGDLYVLVRIEEHPLFKRENEHVLCEMPINFVQAALGAEIEVPTLHGKTKIKVAAGTQSGENIRIRGKGIQRLNGTGLGDHFVRIVVETPQSLTARQKELLLAFEEEMKPTSQPAIAKFLKTISGFFLLFFLLIACSPKAVRETPGSRFDSQTRVEPEARAVYQQAEKAFAAKNYNDAFRLYQTLKNRHPGSRAAALAGYRMGSILYARGDYSGAAREFGELRRNVNGQDLRFDSIYNQAAAEYQAGNAKTAYTILQQLQPEEIRAQESKRAATVYNLLAQSAVQSGNYGPGVEAYSEQMAFSDNTAREKILEKATAAIAKMNSRFDLERLLTRVPEPSIRTKITEQIAHLPSDGIAAAPLSSEGAIPARGAASRYNIGVLLPLSGKWAPFGKRALEGMLLANEHIRKKTGYGFQLFIEDTASTGAQAEVALETLVRRDMVTAVVGPFNIRESTAAAEKAAALGVVNISLSAKEGLTRIGDTIFQTGTTPRTQMMSLVKYCMEKRKFKRFGILMPNNSFGKDMTQEFWDLVEQNGGHVYGYQEYNAGEKDFQSYVRQLIGLVNPRYRPFESNKVADYIKEQKKKTGKEPKTNLPPLFFFEALFIPDSPKTIAQIAPSLAYYEVNGITLLGTSEWNSEQLYQRAGRLIEGAVFPATVPEGKNLAKISEEFSNAFGRNMDSISLQGYEAIEILAEGLARSTLPQNLVAELSRLRDFDTIMGRISMGNNRVVGRHIPIYTVDKSGRSIPD